MGFQLSTYYVYYRHCNQLFVVVIRLNMWLLDDISIIARGYIQIVNIVFAPVCELDSGAP